MNNVKKFFWMTAFGGLVGALTFAWLSPYIIVWYFSPPADLGISCKPAVEWAIDTYRKVMFTGVLLGALFFSVLFFAFFKTQKAGTQSAQPVPPAN